VSSIDPELSLFDEEKKRRRTQRKRFE